MHPLACGGTYEVSRGRVMTDERMPGDRPGADPGAHRAPLLAAPVPAGCGGHGRGTEPRLDPGGLRHPGRVDRQRDRRSERRPGHRRVVGPAAAQQGAAVRQLGLLHRHRARRAPLAHGVHAGHRDPGRLLGGGERQHLVLLQDPTRPAAGQRHRLRPDRQHRQRPADLADGRARTGRSRSIRPR